MSGGFRRGTVLISSLAVVASTLAAPAPVAIAAEPGVDELVGMIDDLADWTSGLGSVGKLGEQLPLLPASPGGLLGYSDLFEKAVFDKLKDATDFDDLELTDENIAIGSGRTGKLNTTVSDEGAGKRLGVVVTVDRSVNEQGLHLASSTPKVDLSISDGVTIELKSRIALDVVWTGGADGQVYLVSGTDSPRLDVDVHASIDDAAAKASVGILGVSLDESELDLDAYFVGKVNDPDNDGKLFFDENGTADGELAQDGSLEGLFSAEFDPAGAKPIVTSAPDTKGSATAEFQLGAAPAADGLNLPGDIDATVGLQWTDISDPATLTVTAPGLADTIGKFQNMSLKDLAEGLAQVIVAINAMQKAKWDPDDDGPLPEIGDLDLPFLRGKLSDAIQAGDTLKKFLADNTVPAPGQPGFVEGVTDPAQAGQPTFTSLQDLLKQLRDDADIDLSGLDWNTTTSKLAFNLAMTKEPPADPVDIDEVSVAASGTGATYGAKTLKVNDAGWVPNQWLGRRVVAGTSAGEVESNTADTITLKQDWIGGQPSDTTGFVISGAEPHLGAVSFADQVQSGGKGIVNANADQTFAKVTPSYTANLTLVLDLQDPVTGDGCTTFPDNTDPCPFTKTDGPFKTEVESLPLNTDRVMLRTGGTLFDADFPIESAVDIDANAGFFKVHLDGDLKVCNSTLNDTCSGGTASGNMLSIDLEPVGDDDNDLRMSQLFKRLVDDPAGLLDFDTNVRAFADVTVSLPDAEDFLPGGASASFTAKWGDLTDPTDVDLNTSGLSEIFQLDFDTDDPKALFTLLIKTLQTLSAQLADADTTKGSGVFGKEIPGMGKSLRQLLLSDESNSGEKVTYGAKTLTDDTRSSDNNPFAPELRGRTVVVGTQIGVVDSVSSNGKTLTMTENWESKPATGDAYAMRSALDDATDRLLASPPDNIQDAIALLNEVLGTDAVQFRYLATGDTGNLVLDVDWQRKYRTAAPIQLGLGSIGGSQRTFAGAEATGQAQVEVTGDIDVGLVIPLAAGDGPADGAALKVLEDSSIAIGAKATFEGVVHGTIGPLSIALGDPSSDEKATAKADLSLALAKSGAAADTPVSFDDFIGDVGVNFNATSGTVDCGDGLNDNLMVCARLPMFLNNSGASNGWQAIDEITLAIPKSTDPADLFDLSGKLVIPDSLAQNLADAILDFGNLGQGLDGYLAKIEAALRIASFEGKLPLIGDDAQQGADFFGNLRNELQTGVWANLPGNGRPADATEVRDYLNEKIADALAEAGMDDISVNVDFECDKFLEPAATPTVSTKIREPGEDEDPIPTANYRYRIVAHQGSGGDTVPSGISASKTGAATLGADGSNTVTWGKVEFASGYKILRSKNGGAFLQVGTRPQPSGDTVTFTDTNNGGNSYTPVTEKPQLDPCPGDAIDGVSVEFHAKVGEVSAAQGCADSGDNECISKNVAMDIGIPGLALRQGNHVTDDGISFKLGFELRVKLALNKTDGLYFATHDGWGADNKAHPELKVGLNFDLPETMLAELAFIKIDVTKREGVTNPLFAGQFQLDLKSDKDEPSCFSGGSGSACNPDDSAKLTLADLGDSAADLFGISLTGVVDIDWIVEASADSALPGVRANFKLDWAFDNKAPNAFGAPTIEFADIGISAGAFFDKVLGEAVEMMKKVTGPIQPVVDTLYAPIPVLSELSRLAGGGDVTLVTLAKTFSTLVGGPKLDFVDTIKSVIEFINRLPECETDCFVPIGSFTLNGGKALTTSNSPTTAASLYEDKKNKGGTTLNPEVDGKALKADLNEVNETGEGSGEKKDVFGSGGGDKGDAEKSGFSFPILDNPAEAFNLLMGGDVTLVEFDSGPLTLGFSWRQDFGPVYAPPPVFVTLAGSASASLRVVAGLDTYGLRKAVEAVRDGDKTDALKVIDGLFFKTVDSGGNPIPVLTLTGEIAAGAAVSAIIIKVGIEGGLRLTINFYWNDPNNDGKFRVLEFGAVALNNPMCLFKMSGKLALFLRVYITLGVSIFSVTFSFELANVTLLDFSVTPDCDPPPPKLGGTVDDTLVVYAGKLGDESFRGNVAWSNKADEYEEDIVKVIQLNYAQRDGDLQGTNPDFDGFAVEMLGERREYLDKVLKRVVVDGSGYGKPMKVTLIGDGKKSADEADAGDDPGVFDRDAFVIGGSGKDTISTGSGLSYVDGKGEADVIVTGDVGGANSKSWVAGGSGADTITVGNGDNRVAGDASLGAATKTVTVKHNKEDGEGTKSVTVFDWTNPADPTTQGSSSSGDDDTIGVGLGANKVRGNGGADIISVATDSPDGTKKSAGNVLIGDRGPDTITGGTNKDEIFTSAEDKFGVDESGPSDTTATDDKPNVVYTGEGSDDVWGSAGVDLVNSHSTKTQQAKLRGGSNRDVLLGGYGTDEVYGGPGDDWLFAEPAEVSGPGADDSVNGKSYGPIRTYTTQPLPAGITPSSKTLVGGLGNDHVVGGDGPATVFGDKYLPDETCAPGDPITSDPVAESTSAATGDGNDFILGGAGVDTVSAGGADDIANVFGADDLACGQEGKDTLRGGNHDDHLWGGSGADLLYGEAGVDHAFGNNGGDTLYGGAADDVIEGNDGSDWASGGAGDDTVYGGTRAAGRDDSGGDDLYGDTGEDTLIGDNGTVSAPYPFDLAVATETAGAGDRIHGGAGEDDAFGGLGNDIVNGNDADDYLEGNNGSDTVHGNAGEDRIIGGSSQEASSGVGRPDSGDTLFGDAGADLITGDNAQLTLVNEADDATRVTRMRGFAKHYQVQLLDLGLSPSADNSGNDEISGGGDQDVAYGQGGHDRIKGNDGDDYAEGGPDTDWIEGNDGDDDLVGGSSTVLLGTGEQRQGQLDAADAVYGGPGDDVAAGDNGRVLRPLEGQDPTAATVRMSAEPGVQVAGRVVELYDRQHGADFLTAPPANRFGGDQMSGGEGVDVFYGQDGADFLSGGAHDDYLQGNGGADVMRGDAALDAESDRFTVPPIADPDWPGSASGAALLIGDAAPAGQDDLIGGSSVPAFRDGGDTVEGNGAGDIILGDNGTLMRTIVTVDGVKQEKVYAERYPNGAAPADATRSRTNDEAKPGDSTRFCTTAQATCEPAGAFGGDTLFGDGGNDGMWGQDGDDTMHGNAGDDEMYGELGDDTLFGNDGDDAILGDRGGVAMQHLDDGDEPEQFTVTLDQVPQESFTAFRRNTVDKRADLLHDVDGNVFVGGPNSPEMPHPGLTEGGADRIRGGAGFDQVHAGFGDDLINGDSGGDVLFGDDGADVMWGGRGCDPVLDAATADCQDGDGQFDPHARGENDRFVDHSFGGEGDDIMDYNPRGTYPDDCAPGTTPVTTGSGKNAVTVDPCSWFEMTDKADGDLATNQHHHGTDWMYGGWDRDVMQGNVTDNGPNIGDRMWDWTGAYNLYTHCNAAYGGQNDVRQLSPDMQEFLTRLAWGDGAGQTADDVTTPGASAYRELALTYQSDFQEHGIGPAFPGTPGHFDQPNSCEE
ncbi:MAG: calcium-binding protein [Actinophytocola sp.]|nr:calcium-binding protein [Actinophytocola sp.]